MDVMQMAGSLSLEFNATVTGPHTTGEGERTAQMAQVLLPNGHGVGIVDYGDNEPPYPSGKINVWGIQDTGERKSPEPPITAWGMKSRALPAGWEYGVTFDRIREVVAALAERRGCL